MAKKDNSPRRIFENLLKDINLKSFSAISFIVVSLVSSGMAFIVKFFPDTFLSLDIIKLLILSITIIFPVFFFQFLSFSAFLFGFDILQKTDDAFGRFLMNLFGASISTNIAFLSLLLSSHILGLPFDKTLVVIYLFSIIFFLGMIVFLVICNLKKLKKLFPKK